MNTAATRLSCRLLARQVITRAGSSQPCCSRSETSSCSNSATSRPLSTGRQVRQVAQRSHNKALVQGRLIHSSAVLKAPASRLVDYLLADVGEGITECEIIKW